MIGIGVVGTGFGRYVHVPGFMSLADAEVVGVASGSYEHARSTAEHYALRYAFKSWKELIECPDIHAVSIATPPHLHEEIALATVEAGKSVFCEKPMAMNAVQSKRMLNAAETAGVIHAIDFEFREIPAFRFAKNLLESGTLGTIRHVQVSWIIGSWADPARAWTWRADRSRGGGVLATLGVHVFDYLEWLLMPIKAIYAHLGTLITERNDDRGTKRKVETEDSCSLIIELTSGIEVTVSLSTTVPFGIGHRIEIYGDTKSLIIDNRNVSDYGEGFQVWEAGSVGQQFRLIPVPRPFGHPVSHKDGRLAPFVSLADKFVNAVLNRKVNGFPTFREGHKARKCMDLAYESNRTGQVAERVS